MNGRSPESDFDALERRMERCDTAEKMLELMQDVFGEDDSREAVHDAMQKLLNGYPQRVESAIHKWADRFWRNA